MGAGFNDQSGDSLALDWQPSADFSVLRSRKRELLAEQRSLWAEGRPPVLGGCNGAMTSMRAAAAARSASQRGAGGRSSGASAARGVTRTARA